MIFNSRFYEDPLTRGKAGSQSNYGGGAFYTTPAVYVAKSAISSGTAGTSSDRAKNTAAIDAGLALIAITAASLILLQVGKSAPQVQTVECSGPPLSYYISKFRHASVMEAPVLPEPAVEALVPDEASGPSAVEAAAPFDASSEINTEAVPEAQVELKEPDAASSSISYVS